MSGAIQLTLERDGHDQPWGFRLQGGHDVGLPLSIQRVLVGTPSEGVLKKGDVILRIGQSDTKGLSHQQAADLFTNVGNQINIHLKRTGITASHATKNVASIAAPQSVPITTGMPGLLTISPTSSPEVTGTLQQLQHPPAFNQTPEPVTNFDHHPMAASQSIQVPAKQFYNNPINLYSSENVAEVAKLNQMGMSGAPKTLSPSSPTGLIHPVNKPPKSYFSRGGLPLRYDPEKSATWQAIHEQEKCQLITEHGPQSSKVYSI